MVGKRGRARWAHAQTCVQGITARSRKFVVEAGVVFLFVAWTLSAEGFVHYSVNQRVQSAHAEIFVRPPDSDKWKVFHADTLCIPTALR